MMPLLLFKILVICTSLLSWVVLSIAGISLFQYNKYNKKIALSIAIVSLLWFVSTYNSWYEGVFLFRKIALMPSLNSWALTLLTPLFYLYFCTQNSDKSLNTRLWIRHLLLPGILAGIYIGMILFNPVPDMLIYNWSEFELNCPASWISFRIGCYLLLIIQLFVYVPRLFDMSKEISDKNMYQIRFFKRELLYILSFYIISVVSMLTPCYICNILYNLSVTLTAGYFLRQSVFYRTIKYKIAFSLQPHSNTRQEEKTDIIILSPPEEEQLAKHLKRMLNNPDLTLKMLAREVGKNATILSRYFNQQLGVRFSDYVTARRVDEAEVLLKDTDITVIEISELVGFQTSSTFYQAFNARHNLPPSQWRKKMNVEL